MDFLNSVFGSSGALIAKFVLSFLIVLALIFLALWLFRALRGGGLGIGSGARGRQPRLAVLDYADVDSRRRLVLIRRDNVEHLILLGGPTDVVVETNIQRGQAPQMPSLRDAALDAEAEAALPRPAPRPPVAEPPVERPAAAVIERAAAATPPTQPSLTPPPAMPPRREPTRPENDPLAALRSRDQSRPAPPLRPASEPSIRPLPPVPPKSEPALEASAPVSKPSDELAARLESVARKPIASVFGERRPPVVPPAPTVTAPTVTAPPVETPVAPEAPPLSAAEPKLEPPALEARAPVAPPVAPPVAKAPDIKTAAVTPDDKRVPETAAPKLTAEDKSIFDSLEEEMASLLGRGPKGS